MFLNKLYATLWKCWRIRCRHYMITLFVVLIPILLYALLAWARTKIGNISKQYINETTYVPAISEDELYQRYRVDVANTYLLYAPSTRFTDQLMRDVQLKMEVVNEKFHTFTSEQNLLEFYKNRVGSEENVYAVVFDHATDAVPTALNYRIRNYEQNLDWQTDLLFEIMSTQYMTGTGSELYFLKAFLNLQLAIDKSYLNMKMGGLSGFDFSMQEFPYPPHTDDMGFTDVFMVLLPLCTVFSTIFIFPGTLKRMMEEKETGIKELTKMMGLPPSVMYLGWFIDALCPVIVSAVVCTLLMKFDWGTAYAPIEYTNGVVYGLFLLLYFSSCIAFCLMVASLCESPALTTSISVLVWIVTYVLPATIQNIKDLGFAINLVLFLVPNFAMYAGFDAISMYEVRGNGVQWNNLFASANGNVNAVPMGYAMIMLLVDAALLLVLGYYFDQIRPGKYGLPKPWNYPCQAFLGESLKKMKRKNSVEDESSDHALEAMIEGSTGNAGISIRNLTKCYGDKVAVDNMSVRFFEGEIAVLLGRNGAGKTTTMSVLTGMTKATRGEVRINNHDISDLSYVRSVMGICPQQDLLFPELTVFEHVMFFAKLHSLHNARRKVEELLEQLRIFDKRDLLPHQISGGMKRKLCLAMAMITTPSLLIMDEPTSGLDPKSRRELWDLILYWRTQNPRATLMVSTHFMEEADVLGDRITVMDSGRLVAQGSPMYLKKQFANECHFTVMLQEDVSPDTLYDLCEKVLGVGNFRWVERENSYTIVLQNDDKEELINLQERIEDADLVKHAGISSPSIEDVFLKLSSGCNQLASVKTPSAHPQDSEGNRSDVAVDLSSASILSNEEPRSWKFSFLDLKHQHDIRYGNFGTRWWRYMNYVSIALPLILLLNHGGNAKSVSKSARPELQLHLDTYGKTLVYYSVDDGIDGRLVRTFEELVQSQRSQAIRVPSVSQALIALGESDMDEYEERAVVALEFNSTQAAGGAVLLNLMYSNGALHGAPIILNLATNMLANVAGGAISAANMPLKTNLDMVIDEYASEMDIVMLWLILAPIALLFLLTSFIDAPLNERVTNFKHLLYMTGVGRWRYWLHMGCIDYLFFYAPVTIVLWIVLFTNTLYKPGCVPLLVWMLAYGVMMIPFVYFFTYKKSVAAAVGSLTILTIFTGMVLPFIIIVLRNSGSKTLVGVGDAAHWLANVSPQYWLANSLITFTRKSVWLHKWGEMQPAQREIMCNMNENPCCDGDATDACRKYKSFLQDGMSPVMLLVAFGMALLYFALLCAADSYVLHRLCSVLCRRTEPFTNFKLRRGAGAQQASARSEELSTFGAARLKKRYGAKEVVESLSFTVQPGECYGLLGVNGAGKTTTFGMITGHVVPTSGTASIRWGGAQGAQRVADMRDWTTTDAYFQMLGYCPQINAIKPELTPRQLLQLFAEHRGVRRAEQDALVERTMEEIGLRMFKDVACGTLSGGNKRKLCLGIALIGNTAVAFLDEPTTGMDPVSRRMVWDVLGKVKAAGRRPLVLTSHSMDECEVLCNELAIMKKGKVERSGNINELKLLYGQGLNVKIKLRAQADEADHRDVVDGAVMSGSRQVDYRRLIENALCSQAAGTVDLKDQHENFLHYFITKVKCQAKPPAEAKCVGECVGRCQVRSLRMLLKGMELLKSMNPAIEDYTIATSTLEDVFLSVARDDEVMAVSV